jgi:cytochrome c
MRIASRVLALALTLLIAAAPRAQAQLRGHGGPVRGLAVSGDGKHAVSGSFDTSVIRWSLTSGTAEQVLRYHEGAVNCVVILKDGRIATSGEDARIAIWRPGEDKPATILKGHEGPVVGLAASADGRWLASAAWDRTARLWPLSGGEPRVLAGHQQNVNGVAFTPDSRALVTAGYDATVRIWPVGGGDPPIVVTLGSPLNAVAVAPDGEIMAAGASGSVYFLSPAGRTTGEIAGTGVPVIALAVSGDGKLAAAAGVRGAVAIIDRPARTIARELVGPGLPVWSAAFLPDNHTLLTGGTDRVIRRWDAATGAPVGSVALGSVHDPLAAYAGDPGAEVFRACVSCHTLTTDEGNRAGPSLGGIFGRRIATLAGYNFSPALKNLDIVWTPETLSKLFEVGPAAYTPGTKMPEQRIGAQDRAALVKFLEKATAGH